MRRGGYNDRMCTPTLCRDINRLQEQWRVSMDALTAAMQAFEPLLDSQYDQAEFERYRANWLAAHDRFWAFDLTLWAAFGSIRNSN